MTMGSKKQLGVMVSAAMMALMLVMASAIAAPAAKKEESKYPNATRSAPKSDLSSTADQKMLQEGLDALNAGEDDKAQQDLQKVVDSSKSKYAKGVALLGLANIKFNTSDYPGAIAYYKQMFDLNSVSNDQYYDSMYNVAAAYVQSEQYQQALDEIKQWREQGKRETADSYALEGNIYYRMQKYPEAVAAIRKAQSMTSEPKDSWNSILMASLSESGKSGEAGTILEQELQKDPKNKGVIHNALVVYVQDSQFDKALTLLERERKDGLLADEKDYVESARFYANIAQGGDKPNVAGNGADLLQEGFSKNIVKGSAENYKLQGDLYIIAQEQDKALAAYSKASPLASNGDIDLTRAQIMGAQQNWPEAKATLEKGIQRGVTKKGKAYVLLGKLDIALKDLAGAKTAFQQAQSDPDTNAEATEQLQKLGATKKKK
ncbi:MAG TPA: tetratricopeptide repeat protein [Rudaea sp.]|jgi:tetratricopeptide (TPR) repeat protein|nr:tetratricopeptide repeat protein [Rudaea sp.]